MILAMAPSHLVIILLEEVQVTAATLGIGYLGFRTEHVSCQEHGVEHSQDVSVSHRINKGEIFIMYF